MSRHAEHPAEPTRPFASRPVERPRPDLQADMHFRVLRLLEQNPDLSQRDLARELGVSLGGAHYCLRALIEKGLVKARNFAASSHKARYSYFLTPAGIAEKSPLTRGFFARKRAEYAALQDEIAALGRSRRRAGGRVRPLRPLRVNDRVLAYRSPCRPHRNVRP